MPPRHASFQAHVSMLPGPCSCCFLFRGPLQQAKERLQARRARPDREQVSDEVETALTVEIAHLNGITQQLATKVRVL